MVKKVLRIALLFYAVWGVTGFFFCKEHTDSVVPLMYVLITVCAIGFLVLSEP